MLYQNFPLNFEEKKQLISTLLDSISEDLVNKEKECFLQCVYCKSSEIKKMGFNAIDLNRIELPYYYYNAIQKGLFL